MKKLALISVSDKSGLVPFAENLIKAGYEIISTGNTARTLKQNFIDCAEISSFTDSPEIFSGRVKTLHPRVFGGILMRRDNGKDLKEAEENDIIPIDIVCVNLYPFPKVVNRSDIKLEAKIENIDIGGPSLIRASAKNYNYISVLTDPSQYDLFISELMSDSGITTETRKKLAADAFDHTAMYDTLIANFFEKEFELSPTALRIHSPHSRTLRYGENPHQKASIYGSFDQKFKVFHGKELSYNNIIDLVAAVDVVQELPANSCAIIKHTNPCGAAKGKDLVEAYEKALSSDPVSAFGGIVSVNGEINAKLAEKLNEIFLEIIVAPSFTDEAVELLVKKKNRRLVKILDDGSVKDEVMVKNIPGGYIVQDKDNSRASDLKLTTVTNKKCPESVMKDLKFAWVICKHVKSNAIVLVKDRKIIGVGAGQMSRLDSAKIAISKAKEFGHTVKGSAAASDAYFPFPDGIETLADEGVNSVVQPGGSVRDQLVIDAANERNISMVFSGIRNFKH